MQRCTNLPVKRRLPHGLRSRQGVVERAEASRDAYSRTGRTVPKTRGNPRLVSLIQVAFRASRPDCVSTLASTLATLCSLAPREGRVHREVVVEAFSCLVGVAGLTPESPKAQACSAQAECFKAVVTALRECAEVKPDGSRAVGSGRGWTSRERYGRFGAMKRIGFSSGRGQ